jgi:hypothetical protein
VPTSVLQIISGRDIMASVRTPEEVTAALQDAEPGRYVVEELSMAGELLPSGYSCQRWVIATLQPDRTVELEPGLPPTRRRSGNRPLCGLADLGGSQDRTLTEETSS